MRWRCYTPQILQQCLGCLSSRVGVKYMSICIYAVFKYIFGVFVFVFVFSDLKSEVFVFVFKILLKKS